MRIGGGGLGLCLALVLGAGCDGTGPATSSAPAATTNALVAGAPAVTGGGPPGVHVSLAGTAHHVRGLERQPDGTYKTVCIDSPEALRPADARSGPRQ